LTEKEKRLKKPRTLVEGHGASLWVLEGPTKMRRVLLSDCERVKMHPGQYLLVSLACLSFCGDTLGLAHRADGQKALNALNEDKYEPETDVHAGALKGTL
jgi:hypothetical protein